MHKVEPKPDWPDSWKSSYTYDLLEVYGEISRRGYAYAYQNRQNYALEALRAISTPGERILDVAAAQGNFSLLLAEMGYEVVWNDLRSELKDYVELKREKGNVEYRVGNIFDFSDANEFDAILATEIIEHVAHPDQFLKKLAFLLKPSGHIILTTPNGEYFRNNLPKFSDCPDPSQFESIQFKPNSDGHIFLFYPDEIQKLAQVTGLQLKELKLFTNPLTAGHIKLELLLKSFPRKAVNFLESITQLQSGFPFRRLNVHLLAVLQKPKT
ncbi:MAG: methyltransferase domain-containing protein [Cyanobacteriota bacterium]|nr:methyltransferase domain-containing protein [Cyanobacteriota bacterium]